MKARTALLAALLGLLLTAPANAARTPGAVVLVEHGGAFSADNTPVAVRSSVRYFRRQHVRTVVSDYPLESDPKAAYDYVRREARSYKRQGYRVYCIGFSAGGSICSQLAGRGAVKAAASIAPVTDFTRWAFRMRGALRRESPVFAFSRRRAAPNLIIHARDDQIVPFEQSALYAAANARVMFSPASSGNHLIANEPSAKADGWLFGRIALDAAVTL